MHTAEPTQAISFGWPADVGADLVVTGGYGHSQLGEWIFGGVTQSLLQQAPTCLLMSALTPNTKQIPLFSRANVSRRRY